MKQTWMTLKILLYLTLVAVPILFVIQNRERSTELSLDLGFAAWKLADPVSIPYLLAGTLVVGVLFGLLIPWLWQRRSRGADSFASETGAGDSW
jgi:hypothetical protein